MFNSQYEESREGATGVNENLDRAEHQVHRPFGELLLKRLSRGRLHGNSVVCTRYIHHLVGT